MKYHSRFLRYYLKQIRFKKLKQTTMKKIILTLGLVITVFMYSGFVNAQTSYNFDQGLEAAKSQNKLIAIYIYSDGDRWCQKMNDEVFSSSAVNSALSSFIFVKINTGSSDVYTYSGEKLSASDLAKKLGVMSYPTSVFMNANGTVISFLYNGVMSSNVPGFIDEEDYIAMLKYIRQGKYTTDDLSDHF